jgi:hypothetical protein
MSFDNYYTEVKETHFEKPPPTLEQELSSEEMPAYIPTEETELSFHLAAEQNTPKKKKGIQPH